MDFNDINSLIDIVKRCDGVIPEQLDTNVYKASEELFTANINTNKLIGSLFILGLTIEDVIKHLQTKY